VWHDNNPYLIAVHAVAANIETEVARQGKETLHEVSVKFDRVAR
jgi:hypothetical protein